QKPGLTERDGHVVSVTVVQEKGQPLGLLQVVYDTQQLREHLMRNLLFAALAALAIMVLASIAARHLARVLTRPLAKLTNTAQRVTQTRDYSLRAPEVTGDNEISAFADTFNDMLGQIQQQDDAIKASREQATAASRLKDEFLATLSHELRTPMTPILGWAQILRRTADGNPRVLQAAEVIERNALAQVRLVDDLLDMSRIISGKIAMDMQIVPVANVLAAALDAVRDAARARDIELRTTIDEDLPPLRADPHRLQQILWNLLSNAVKFTPPGGQVDVSVHAADFVMSIIVKDSGQGIPENFLPYVFERFRQVDSSITRSHGGLGLGLAIVKQLVELHGGAVSVASDGADMGTTFTVTMPMRPLSPAALSILPAAAPTARRSLPADDSRSLQGLRLLVVDNELDALLWLEQVLTARGAHVTCASSAEEALSLLHAQSQDVLLSDIGMPITDGYQLLRHVRALPESEGGKIPAIALTAFVRSEDHERAMQAGYQLHLGKPTDENALVAAILSLVPALIV
ncbi:MAG TPA: hybrid sensor histidine kinase/response regulator, partial [Luteimonas sp.]|nr:hybrid sensor histidine kinase/response regulator [Luteimonas sp.]